MSVAIDKATGVRFDDYVLNEADEDYPYEHEAWANVCVVCVARHSLPMDCVTEDGGSGYTCCVEGCWYESDFYYEFDIHHLE